MDTRPSLGIGIDVPAGQVILRVIVATTQDQQGLDEKYGVDVVRLQGELVPARQREPLIATSPVWPTHLDRTQPEPESYCRVSRTRQALPPAMTRTEPAQAPGRVVRQWSPAGGRGEGRLSPPPQRGLTGRQRRPGGAGHSLPVRASSAPVLTPGG